MAPQHGKSRLFLRADDVERYAGFAIDALDEFRAVAGTATGFGRYRSRQRDMAAAQLVRADRQGSNRPVYRRVADPASGRQPLAQTHDPRKSIDADETVSRRLGDQQAAIVGAKVDRGIGSPFARAIRRKAPLR